MIRREMYIGSHIIGTNHKPFIVAEMSGNHNQSLKRALAIVEAAAESGVQAIKLQTYTADTMTLDLDTPDFVINDAKSLWHGKRLHDLYEEAHTPWEWHPALFKRCHELGLLCFSTPFDETAVDFLESLNAPCYKIASFENTDTALLRKVAATGKPVIISTGMARLSELELMVNTVRSAGGKDVILLQCTSSYPADPENSNLLTIPHMAELFDCEVGLSDHTMGLGAAVASVALGARFIEKHFTLSRAEGGVDAAFSLEPQEMKQLTVECERAWQALGKVTYGVSGEAEEKSLQFRRSLYVVKDLRKGDILDKRSIRAIRPGFGLAPKHFDQLMGKAVKCDVKAGTPMSWDLI